MLERIKFLPFTDKAEISFAISFQLVHIRVMSDGVEVPFHTAAVKPAFQCRHIGEVVDRIESSLHIHGLSGVEIFLQARQVKRALSGTKFLICDQCPFPCIFHVGKVTDGVK